ncbi:MAG TPA: helix-turn-helix domain-containing protein [Conexibacter sp.]|jgi:AcrR family transcriptional regulator
MSEEIAGLHDSSKAAVRLRAIDGEQCDPGVERPGLRERKKLRTYETIAAAALDLFDRQGFRATTIAQIAETADVSPRTVSAYFPAKEELLFPHSEESFEALAQHLRERPADQLATDALRSWIESIFEERDQHHKHDSERKRRRVIESDESLRAYERHQLERAEGLFASAVAQDLGTEPDDVAARFAAAAAVGALTAIGRIGAATGQIRDPVAHREAALAVLDQAIVFLSGGLRELRNHRGDQPPTAGGE